MADVAAHQYCARQIRTAEALTAASEHRRGSIDPHHRCTCAGHRYRDASCSTSQFEHAAALRRGDPTPERDVTTRNRPRVLPVIEGGVVVPALPAFGGPGHSCRWPT